MDYAQLNTSDPNFQSDYGAWVAGGFSAEADYALESNGANESAQPSGASDAPSFSFGAAPPRQNGEIPPTEYPTGQLGSTWFLDGGITDLYDPGDAGGLFPSVGEADASGPNRTGVNRSGIEGKPPSTVDAVGGVLGTASQVFRNMAEAARGIVTAATVANVRNPNDRNKPSRVLANTASTARTLNDLQNSGWPGLLLALGGGLGLYYLLKK